MGMPSRNTSPDQRMPEPDVGSETSAHLSAKELRQRISGRPIVCTALINRPRSGHCPLHQYLFKPNHRLDGRPNPYYFISSLNLWGRG
ncbi:hypothetical protein PGT21_018410 [Puccinia graminis f. sp. tritici]|uniref:Uncharacterized protein n=1 Tax=Puccinia graminis f. sp. tritici TaxID=56615 RepID=A0A5B0PUG6_PUCGR|nr:hypothetical protein PGT21_018410 [Puccinia graminis f. sp. tritici]